MNATSLTKPPSSSLERFSPSGFLELERSPGREGQGRFERGLAIGLSISAVLWALMFGVGYLAFRLLGG